MPGPASVSGGHPSEVCTRQRGFALCFRAMPPFATCQCLCNQRRSSTRPYSGEVWLQKATDPRQVAVDGGGIDMVGHEDNIERQSVGGGFDGEVV